MSRIYDFIRRIFSRDARIASLMNKLVGGDIGVSLRAAETLGEIGEPSVPILVDALKNEDAIGRERAAEALGKIAEKNPRNPEVVKTVPALCDAIKDGAVGSKAIWVLGKIAEKNPGNPEVVNAVPALIDALKDEYATVRATAVWALGKTGDVGAVPPLIEAMKNKNALMRWIASDAFGNIISSFDDVRLREVEDLVLKKFKEAERGEKDILLGLLDKVNKRKGEILEPEVKKLKLPRKTKRRKPKRRIWRAIQ